MKKFKNRKNVKNVNNTVKNNANMNSFEELVKAAKEFKGALDDEVANREYERKKCANANVEDFKAFMVVVKSAMQEAEDAINAKIDINAKKGVNVERVMEAAGLLKDSVVDEQAKKIEELDKYKKLVKGYRLELSKLQEADMRLAAHFEGVCAERDNLAACLKSCERDLKHKDKVIERIKKKNAKRMSEKCEVIAVLNKEIEFQYKRREKAEKFVNTLGQAFDLLKKNVEDYEHSIGR